MASASATFEVTVERDDLLREIALAGLIVPAKPSMPILGHLYMTTIGDNIAIRTTNLDLTIQTTCKAKVQQEGVCVIPARKLHEYIRLLPPGPISLKHLPNQSMQVRSGQSSTRIRSMEVRTFPALQVGSSKDQFDLPAQQFRALIELTAFAAGSQERGLDCAQFEIVHDEMRMVATDGHRIAKASARLSAPESEDKTILIPSIALKGLAKLIGEEEAEDLLVSEDDSSIYFAVGDRRLVVRKLKRTFPNYSQAITDYVRPGIHTNAPEMSAALRRTMLFMDRLSGCIALEFSESQLEVRCASADYGEAEERLEITGGPEESLAIGFSGAYLLDCLELLKESVAIHLGYASDAPVVFAASFEDETQLTYVVAPIRLPSEAA